MNGNVPSIFQRLQQSNAAKARAASALVPVKRQLSNRPPAANQAVSIYPGATFTTTATTGNWSITNTTAAGGSGTITTSANPSGVIYWERAQYPSEFSIEELIAELAKRSGPVKLLKGKSYLLKLPDGTRLHVKTDGSFEILDKNAKIVYAAARFREFNPFLNASDKMEAFIDFCASKGVTKEEMTELPVKLFINWLIIEAAKADRETPPDLPLLPAPKAESEELPFIWI